MLDKLAQYSLFWLGVYALGTGMIIATIGHVAGAVAAGSATGFFLLAGMFGYESLTRRSIENTIKHRLGKVEKEYISLSQSINVTQDNIVGIQKNMADTSRSLIREISKLQNKSEPSARASVEALNAIQRSFQNIGRSAPAHLPDEPQEISETIVESHIDIAPEPSATLRAPSRKQKYKDLLMKVATQNSNHAADSVIPSQEEKYPPAPQYSNEVITELVNHAVQSERIEIFAQPVVRLPSRRLQYIELFARIRARSGIYLSANNYRALAEKETLIENVDRLLLLHVLNALQHDERRGIDISYFINISSRCLKDRFYMAELIEFARTHRALAARLIFELQESDTKNLTPACYKLINGLAHIGCQFSIDNIAEPDINAEKFAKMGVNYIKLGAPQLVKMCETPTGEMAVARLKSRMDKANIKLIIDKLEDENDLKELLDFEIDYGEGYLFGEPDLEMAYRPKRTA